MKKSRATSAASFFSISTFPLNYCHILCALLNFSVLYGTPELPANAATNSLMATPTSGYFSRTSALTTGVKSSYNYIYINPFIFNFSFW